MWKANVSLGSLAIDRSSIYVACLVVLACGCGSPSRPSDPSRLQDYQVATSSMAPALTGASLTAECKSCLVQHKIATETYKPGNTTRCFSCGNVCEVDQTLVPGTVAQLSAYLDTESANRFDVIVFSDTLSDDLRVKRVWGLPGEQIQIQEGELWVNGKLFQKSLRQLERLCVPISRFPSDTRSGWSVGKSDSQERQPIEDRADQFALELSYGENLCWQYRKPARLLPSASRKETWLVASEINDDYPCNQGLSYQLQPVADFLLSIEFAERLTSPVEIACDYLGRTVVVCAIPATAKTIANGARVTTVRCNCSLTIACCDRRVLLHSDQEDHVVPYESMQPALPGLIEIDCKVQIRPRSTGISLSKLHVGRDLYLRTTHRDGAGKQQFGVVSIGHYFVLGDNQPASVDSRHSMGTVPRNRLRGIVWHKSKGFHIKRTWYVK